MNKSNPRLNFLAAISGVMIALQARANGELSHRMGNPIEAALVSFGSGLIVISVIAVFNPAIKQGIRNLKSAVAKKEIPIWPLFAGMLGGSFVAFQTQVVPIVGVAIYSVASIAGQTAFSLFAVFFGVFAGAIVGVQRALNGQINESTQQSFTTSLLNFIMGTTFLLVFLVIAALVTQVEIVALPSGPWWMYTGGTIGVIYIAFTSTIVQHLGVLTFTLISVGGQLIGSLLIDLYSPTKGVQVSAYLVTGILMTYLGVVVGGVGNSRRTKLMKR